jgi:hypothetical protein
MSDDKRKESPTIPPPPPSREPKPIPRPGRVDEGQEKGTRIEPDRPWKRDP